MIVKNRYMPLFVWATLALCSLFWFLFKIPIRSDISLFLPDVKTQAQRLLLGELREGPAARILLLAIEGGSAEDRSVASMKLASRLSDSSLFLRVENGRHDFAPEAEKLFFDARYLISPSENEDQYSASNLHAALSERLKELRSPISALYKKILPADPTGELVKLVKQLEGTGKPNKHLGVWFSKDLNKSLLMLETKASGFDLDSQLQALNEIQKAFQGVSAGKDIKLIISGPGIFGVKSREVISKESTVFSVLASIIVIGILLSVYRSAVLLIAGAIPLISAFLAGTFLVSLAYGSIHGITLAFGITLLGVTMDYPIHLFSHMETDKNSLVCLDGIWPTIRLGALTTSIGFLAMMFTQFNGLAQLGLFAVGGIVAAALTTRYVLPCIVSATSIRNNQITLKGWQQFFIGNSKMRWLLLVVGLIGVVVVVFFEGPRWENDLAAMSPIPQEMIKRDRELRELMNAPEVSHMVVIQGISEEEVLEKCEEISPAIQRLVDDQLIAGYDPVCRYLPSKKKQLMKQQLLPSPVVLKNSLAKALVGLPFDLDFFETFLSDVEIAKGRSLLALKDLEGTRIGLRISSQLFAIHGGWIGIITISGAKKPNLIVKRMLNTNIDGTFYINLKAESNSLMEDFRFTALNRLAIGACLLLLSLVVSLRSLKRALLVVSPVFLALLVEIALLLLIGERLSLFHLISILLVFGITLDYSLFLNREGDSEFTRIRTFHSLTICCFSTISFFGLLGLSSLPVLGAIGKTVTIGVILGYLFTFSLAKPLRSHS